MLVLNKSQHTSSFENDVDLIAECQTKFLYRLIDLSAHRN